MLTAEQCRAQFRRIVPMRLVRLSALCVLVSLAVTSAAVAAEREAAPTTVTILPFQSRGEDTEQEWLSLALADLFMQSLLAIPPVQVLDRQEIRSVIAELELGLNGLIEAAAAAQAGRLARIDYVIYGSYLDQGKNLAVEVHAVDVRTGQLVGGVTFQHPKDDLIAWVPRATVQLLGQIRGGTDKSWEQRLQQLPRRSLSAIESYCRGILALERGDLMSAASRLLQTLTLDAQMPETHYWLGFTLDKLGQTDHALLHFAALATFDSTGALSKSDVFRVLMRLRAAGLIAEHEVLFASLLRRYAAISTALPDEKVPWRQGHGPSTSANALANAAQQVSEFLACHGYVPTNLPFVNYLSPTTNVCWEFHDNKVPTGEIPEPVSTTGAGSDRSFSDRYLFAAPPGKLITRVTQNSPEGANGVVVSALPHDREFWWLISPAWFPAESKNATYRREGTQCIRDFAVPQKAVLVFRSKKDYTAWIGTMGYGLGEPTRSQLLAEDKVRNATIRFSFGLIDETNAAKIVTDALPRGAAVLVDNFNSGIHTPGTLFLAPGPHTIEFSTNRFKPRSRAQAFMLKTGEVHRITGICPGADIPAPTGTDRSVTAQSSEKAKNSPVVELKGVRHKVIWHSQRSIEGMSAIVNYHLDYDPRDTISLCPDPDGKVQILWSVRNPTPLIGGTRELWRATYRTETDALNVSPVTVSGLRDIRLPRMTCLPDGRFLVVFWALGTNQKYRAHWVLTRDIAKLDGAVPLATSPSLTNSLQLGSFRFGQQTNGMPFLTLPAGPMYLWDNEQWTEVDSPGYRREWESGQHPYWRVLSRLPTTEGETYLLKGALYNPGAYSVGTISQWPILHIVPTFFSAAKEGQIMVHGPGGADAPYKPLFRFLPCVKEHAWLTDTFRFWPVALTSGVSILTKKPITVDTEGWTDLALQTACGGPLCLTDSDMLADADRHLYRATLGFREKDGMECVVILTFGKIPGGP